MNFFNYWEAAQPSDRRHELGRARNYGSLFDDYKQLGNGQEGGLLDLEYYQEVKALHFG